MEDRLTTKEDKMKAEEFFRMKKEGRKLENEYFIAMDKTSFFKLMEDYANYKMSEPRRKHMDRPIISKVSTTMVKEYI